MLGYPHLGGTCTLPHMGHALVCSCATCVHGCAGSTFIQTIARSRAWRREAPDSCCRGAWEAWAWGLLLLASDLHACDLAQFLRSTVQRMNTRHPHSMLTTTRRIHTACSRRHDASTQHAQASSHYAEAQGGVTQLCALNPSSQSHAHARQNSKKLPHESSSIYREHSAATPNVAVGYQSKTTKLNDGKTMHKGESSRSLFGDSIQLPSCLPRVCKCVQPNLACHIDTA